MHFLGLIQIGTDADCNMSDAEQADEMIHMMLYEEECQGLDDPRGYIQDGPRAVT